MQNTKVLLRVYLFVRKFLLLPFLITRRTVSGVKEPIKKILVLRYDRIGDMVLTTPLFASLKKNIPGCRITVLASQVNKDVVRNDPNVDEVVVYQGAVKFMRDFRRRGIDLTIDPFCSYELKPALLAFLSGAKYRIGFADSGREVFFNIKGLKPDSSKHMVDQLLSLLAPLAIKEDQVQPKIYLTPEEIENAKAYFTRNNYVQDCLKIAVIPGAYYPSQRWPLERFVELIKKICEKSNARVLIFTDKEEVKLEAISELLDPARVEVIFGLALRQFMAYLSQCHLLICNNTGSLHIASGLGVPTVSTMGPTVPHLWWPQGKNHIVIRRELACSPCNKAVCRGHECMKLISIEEVEKAVAVLLKSVTSIP